MVKRTISFLKLKKAIAKAIAFLFAKLYYLSLNALYGLLMGLARYNTYKYFLRRFS